MNTMGLRAFLSVCFLAAGVAHGDQSQHVDLLRQAPVKLIRHSPLKGEWQAAVDASPSSAVRLQRKDETIEVVLQVADQVATADAWSVTLAKSPGPIRVEILGSTLSPRTGFTLLRGDTLTTKNFGKKLPFRARGVKFLMLRFTPMDAKQESISLADVSVFGRLGAPQTNYSFKESPARVLDVLAQLKQSDALMITISDAEADLFADARDRRLDDWSLAEAMLLASGVTNETQRKQLLRRIDTLERDSEEAIQDAATPFAKGDALLRWLHRKGGPLEGGYVAKQTRLDVLLKQKTFNCVSSAAIFAILAKRHGLDVRAIEVPDHAFAVVYDGAKHADVETTNARGFNPARDRAAQKAFEAQTGLSYIPDSHRDKRREITAEGLVAITYYNRGVALTENKDHHQALVTYFCAMSMDPEFNSAVKNALAGLVNWGNELLDREQFAASVKVIETGLSLAPQDASLVHNQEVAYSKWAVALGNKKMNEQALKVLRQAAKSRPDGDFIEMQSWLFVKQGEELIKQKQWTEAIRTAEDGLSKIDEAAKSALRDWRGNVTLRWADDRFDAKDFRHAVKLLEEGFATTPDDTRYERQLAFVFQEWAKKLQAEKGDDAARTILVAAAKKHEKSTRVRQVAGNFARNGYIKLRQTGKLDQAQTWIGDNQSLLSEEEGAKLKKDLWQAYTRREIQAKDWTGAEEKLNLALKEFPNEGRFQQNLAYAVQQQAQQSLTKGPKAARERLLELSRKHSKRSRVVRAIEGAVHSAMARSLAKNDAKQVWSDFDSLRGVLPEAGEAKLARIVTDQLAGPFHKAQKWEDALAVYNEGLKRLPDDRHMRTNTIATWHSWARVSMDAKDWESAAKVYGRAIKRFPNERSFKQNFEYCEHQLKQ